MSRISELAPSFSLRSAQYDRDATFPYENWTELAAEGFLGLCAPKEYGGYEADFVGYALVSEELARACPTTALTFNMHTATALLAGWISEELDFNNEMKQHLERTRPSVMGRNVLSTSYSLATFFRRQDPREVHRLLIRLQCQQPAGTELQEKKYLRRLSGAADIHNVVAIVEGDRETEASWSAGW